MIKIMCFLKRKAGMSPAEFKAYYESTHAPLIEKMLPFYATFERNFFAPVQDYETGHMDNISEQGLDFDVVTELTFATKKDYAKIVAIAHGRYDLDAGVALNNDFLALKGFAGIATSLVDDAKRLGISRAMSITRNGIHTDRFDMSISERLSVLGYAGADAAYTHAGVEWKRGKLAEEIAARVGLPLVKAGFRPFISMSNFYQTTDCVIVTSDENEACGLPLMESAASGRLPLSARIGITCEFKHPPGIIVPTEPDDFVQAAVEHLSELIASPARYRLMCETAQEFTKKNYDWSVVASAWAEVILSDCPGT